jgi:hypothetical protein
MRIEKYTTYLDGDFSVDYWSDEGICHAASLLEEFTTLDWEKLKKSIPVKSDLWATRCAETLSETDNKNSFDVLLDLINAKSCDVRTAALDTINSLISQGFDAGEHVEKIRSAVLLTKNTADSISMKVLDSLEKKLA